MQSSGDWALATTTGSPRLGVRVKQVLLPRRAIEPREEQGLLGVGVDDLGTFP